MNPEENKMGIKGSSTRQIFFNDVKVPVENLLGRRGEGYRIALNILHVGRIKLGATVIGGMRRAINYSVNYALERKQFGSALAEFGAIKHKLAEQVIRTFSTESAVYRASKDVENEIEALKAAGKSYGQANIGAVAEFEPECALLKVYGSESLDYIVDELVQIYGGMGFSAEAPADRSYRDSRINRIFEGTNEINRLIVADAQLKRGLRHKIALMEKAAELLNDKTSLLPVNPDGKSYYTLHHEYVDQLKKAIVILYPLLNDTFKKKLVYEEEIMMNVANMSMYLYVLESTLLRVEKLEKKGLKTEMAVYHDMLDVLLQDVMHIFQRETVEAVSAFLEGEQKDEMLQVMKNLTAYKPLNTKEARRRIANKLIEDERYKF